VAGKHNRNCLSSRFSYLRRWLAPCCGDYIDLSAHQVGCETWQSIIVALRPAVFDRHVLPLNKAGSLETLAELSRVVRTFPLRRQNVHEANSRHHGLLRARGDRPRTGRAAEQRDELAPVHSITSSAATS